MTGWHYRECFVKIYCTFFPRVCLGHRSKGILMSPGNVGKRIRQLRLSRGLSVRALAAETGFSPSLISQVEHGHAMPSIGSLERIAMVLGVSLSTFFAESETNAEGLVRANAR